MNSDLVWCVEWLSTLVDRMPDDSSVREFLSDLSERRATNSDLNRIAQEANL